MVKKTRLAKLEEKLQRELQQLESEIGPVKPLFKPRDEGIPDTTPMDTTTSGETSGGLPVEVSPILNPTVPEVPAQTVVEVEPAPNTAVKLSEVLDEFDPLQKDRNETGEEEEIDPYEASRLLEQGDDEEPDRNNENATTTIEG